MATRPTTTIAISQMLPMDVVQPDGVIPVVYGGNNYIVKISSITSSITKESLGLGNVQNIAPENMPVSVAQQAALDQKLDKNGSIPQSQVINLTEDLQGKLDKTGTIQQSQVTGLVEDIYMLQTAPIRVSRIEGFELGVQQIIDQQPESQDSVIQGIHSW